MLQYKTNKEVFGIEREQFNFLVDYLLKLQEGSVKKACFIAREYIRCEKNNKLDYCAVSKEEFYEAIDTLIVYSYKTSDENTMVEQWQCDNDCNRYKGRQGFCQGEFQASEKSGKKLCKYFSEPTNI